MRVSIRDLAREAGVHHTTISRALRNDRQISAAARTRIQKLAHDRGYVPDPMLTSLIAYRKRKSVLHYEGTLAWINTHPQPEHLYKGHQFPTYYAGAKERSAELGYQLEEFRLADIQMNAGRLSKIFRARNIQGLLLAPQSRARAHINLEWDYFSAISFGFSLARPHLHIVTNAQFQSCRLGVRKLRSLGYRRIGFINSSVGDERTDQNFLAAFLVEQRRFLPSEQIPVLTFRKIGKVSTREFYEWYSQHQPEAILSSTGGFVPSKERKKCGIACLDLPEDQVEFSGVHQNDRLIGRTAVDSVISMIHNNERGLPAVPKRILIEGRWVDGASAPRVRFPSQSRRAG